MPLEKFGVRRVHEIFRHDPGKTGNVIHVDARCRDAASGEIRLQRCVVVPAGQNSRRLAVLRDVDHFVQGALKAARTGRIDGYGNQAGAHTAKERADHLQPWRVGEQKPVAGRKMMILS